MAFELLERPNHHLTPAQINSPQIQYQEQEIEPKSNEYFIFHFFLASINLISKLTNQNAIGVMFK